MAHSHVPLPFQPFPIHALTSADAALSNIPIHLLHAELSRRQSSSDRPECGSSSKPHNYNTPLHVFALFLILALSTFACSFPLIVRRFPSLPVPNYSLFLSRHFGTGVLIATAFVHLLPTAYISLTDPCLPRFWNNTYPAMAGLIAMVSVLVVVAIEMFFALKGAGHSHSVDLERLRGGDGEEGRREVQEQPRRSGNFKRFRQSALGGSGENGREMAVQRSPYSDNPGSLNKPLPPPPPPREAERDGDEDSDLDLDELEDDDQGDSAQLLRNSSQPPQETSSTPRPAPPSRTVSFAEPLTTPIPASPSTPPTNAEQRLILQCLLLEAGILFHSIFIGMALSVSTGPPFLVLLIAISFHQTFEGLALGSRIAAIPSFATTSWKPWLMSVMYGVTTPAGQAIGLAVHSLYDPASQFGLLMVGCVNAVSSGLLLYAGLVQLLAEDFLSEESYVCLRGRRRLEACGAVVAGSLLMALVGAWA